MVFQWPIRFIIIFKFPNSTWQKFGFFQVNWFSFWEKQYGFWWCDHKRLVCVGNMVQALWCRRAMGARLADEAGCYKEGGPQIQTAIVGGTMVYLWTDVFEYIISNCIILYLHIYNIHIHTCILTVLCMFFFYDKLCVKISIHECTFHLLISCGW